MNEPSIPPVQQHMGPHMTISPPQPLPLLHCFFIGDISSYAVFGGCLGLAPVSLDHLLESHGLQGLQETLRCLAPHIPSDARGRSLTGRGCLDTIHKAQRSFQHPHDVLHGNLGRLFRQFVIPVGATNGMDKPHGFQGIDQVPQVFLRDPLRLAMSFRSTGVSPLWRARSSINLTPYRPFVDSFMIRRRYLHNLYRFSGD